jgi:hypothetical protein
MSIAGSWISASSSAARDGHRGRPTGGRVPRQNGQNAADEGHSSISYDCEGFFFD